MKNSSSILTDIEHRLQDVQRRQNRIDLLSNFLIFFTGVIIAATLLVVTEILFDFSHIGRTIIFVLFVFSLLGVGSWTMGRPFLRLIHMLPSVSETSTALHIGAFFPSIRDRLLNALQLAKNAVPDSMAYSADLIDESLKIFCAEIQPLDFTRSVNTSHLPLYRRWLMISAGVSILFVCIFPASFSGASYRLIHFTTRVCTSIKIFF